jgi:NADH dehydrogenase/NADH:ubiquinone oxidoreductase subunit G
MQTSNPNSRNAIMAGPSTVSRENQISSRPSAKIVNPSRRDRPSKPQRRPAQSPANPPSTLLETLDFLVVQDGFHPTPKSELANLVFPTAIWGENEGTYTNSERRVSKVNRALDPPDDAKPDFEIFLAFAETLGCREELFPGWTKPEHAFNEWKRVSSGRLCERLGKETIGFVAMTQRARIFLLTAASMMSG